MGPDNIEFREIATKMFLQENQYKLARKLNRKKLLGGETGCGGGGGWEGYSLSTIWLK